MDFHILIVIGCVFLASLFSLLLINKFFKRKTFEEIIAEKKAMTEKIYGQNKSALRKPKKLQQLKKEQKREKKQRQKEQQRDNEKEAEEDSDAQSEHASVEDEQSPQGLSKIHVEFEPDPEILTYTNNSGVESVPSRRASNADKDNIVANPSTKQSKSKKDKKGGGKSGILVNKNEPTIIKEHPAMEESLNNFESKPPKDTVELKKQEKQEKAKEIKEDKPTQQSAVVQQQQQLQQPMDKPVFSKKEKVNKKDKPEQQAAENVPVAREFKQLDEKLVRQGSPKNNSNNKLTSKSKKQNKETAATKLVVALDKLSETDTIGVSLLMNLFRRAELNRSEIQLLIDYLLNKQQDMPNTHSEWSDDICQKLKRQLEEKERLLAEEQEASMGIQAKLRELRTEINTERAQMNANVKAYIEKIQSKEQELTAVNQEMQALNDKIALERQQFQAKLIREKQAGSQDLLAQLQMMQNELAHKDKCINELTCMMNASHQAVEDSKQKTSELIQTQVQQIRALEQQRDELEQISNNRMFEIEQAKSLETENAENKVEILNLQNALESTKGELLQERKEIDSLKAELARMRNVELNEKQSELDALQAKNTELTQQIAELNNKSQEQSKDNSDLQTLLDSLRAQVEEQEQELQANNIRISELTRELTEAQREWKQGNEEQDELKKNINLLKTEVTEKNKKILDAEEVADRFNLKEKELFQQLQEQKDKNNQQQQLLMAAQKSITTATATTTTTTDPPKDEKQIRELFQRLYPDAAKACASSALTLSFEQWIEKVVAAQIKQSIPTISNTTSSNTQLNAHSGNSNHRQNNESDSPHNDNSPSALSNSADEPAEHNVGRGAAADDDENGKVENLLLRNANADELTHLVKKTGNTSSDFENCDSEKGEQKHLIVPSNDEQQQNSSSLQHSNGEQDI